MRVLIVEDYTPLRVAVSKGLSDAGFSVDAVARGDDGLWHAESSLFIGSQAGITIDAAEMLRRHMTRGDSLLSRQRQAASYAPAELAREAVQDPVVTGSLTSEPRTVESLRREELEYSYDFWRVPGAADPQEYDVLITPLQFAISFDWSNASVAQGHRSLASRRSRSVFTHAADEQERVEASRTGPFGQELERRTRRSGEGWLWLSPPGAALAH